MKAIPINRLMYFLIFCQTFGFSWMASGATANVQVGQIFFNPTSTTINVGDTVTWTWVGGFHDVTSDTGIWSSPTQSSGMFSRQFNSPGDFPYYCTIHSAPGGNRQNAVITVIALNHPPSVSITSPAAGTVFTAPASFTIDATASDSDGTVSQVEFFVNGSSIGIVPNSPYSANASNLSSGIYTLAAVATDNGGAKATNSISVIVNNPPSITVTNPVNGTVFLYAPTNIIVGASASDTDGTISQVQFFLDNVAAGIDTTSPYSFTNNNVAAGNHTLTAVATDNRGAKTTNSISVILNSPPTTSITNIVNGSVFSAGTSVQLKATANDIDGSVTQVQFFNGAILLGTVAGAPYNFTLAKVTNGNYAFTTQAMDNRGAISTSPTINVVVTTITLLSATVPANGQFQFTLSGLVIGKTNVIQASTNLGSPTNWISLKTNVAVAGTTNFLDKAATNVNPRFYRVIELP